MVIKGRLGYKYRYMKKFIDFIQKYWWAVSIGAGILVFIIAVVMSLGLSVWFDEGYSILISKEPVETLLAHTAVDAHPPLYYLLLKWWGSLFDFNETALRALSAIFAGASVTLGLGLTKRLFGFRAALMSLPVILLAPFVLRYGFEIRMYSLTALIGVGATYALVLARQTKKLVWWAVYAALVALGMYTLYIVVVLWVSHLVWLIWTSRKDKLPIRQWKWVWAYVGSVVLFLPYIVNFFRHIGTSVLSGVGTEITLTKLVDVVTIFLTYKPEWTTGGWVSLAVLALLIGLIGSFIAVFSKVKNQQRRYLMLYVFMAGIPLLFFAIMSLPPLQSIFLPRYLSHVAIWIYLLVAVVIALSTAILKNKWRTYGVYGLLLLILGYGTFNLTVDGNITFERVQKPMARQLHEEFEKLGLQCDDSTTLLADDPYIYIETIYYYEPCEMKFYYPEDFVYRGGYAPLSGSDLRVETSEEIDTERLIHLRESHIRLEIDERYTLVESVEYSKQHLDIYQLAD